MDDRLIVLAVVFLTSAIGSWWATRTMKGKLARVLGRKVENHEETSISAWMKADEQTLDRVIHDESDEHQLQEAMEDAERTCLGMATES